MTVPATPGSIYGGSRNIMKNSINQSPFHKYIFNTPSYRNNLHGLSNTSLSNNNAAASYNLPTHSGHTAYFGLGGLMSQDNLDQSEKAIKSLKHNNDHAYVKISHDMKLEEIKEVSK